MRKPTRKARICVRRKGSGSGKGRFHTRKGKGKGSRKANKMPTPPTQKQAATPKKSKKTSPVPEKISQPVFEEPVVDEPVTDVYADDNVDSAKEDCECTACTIM